MEPLYVFEFVSDEASVILDVYEDANGDVFHSLREKTNINKRQSVVNQKYCKNTNKYTAYLFYPEIIDSKRPIASVVGFDFSVCTEKELNLFLSNLIFWFGENTRFEIDNIKKFAEFAALMDDDQM